MKNLLIYINPNKKFEGEEKTTIKIQIDNSLGLGWKKEDIMLVTNFPYEYNGVNSLVVEDDAYCDYFPRCSKWPTIIKLFNKNLIEEKEIYWYHDLDAFQLEVIKESDIPGVDMALCDYGRTPLWHGGSIFFRKGAQGIFDKTKEIMDTYKTHEGVEVDEVALFSLTSENEEIKKRVIRLNNTYNFHRLNIHSNYPAAEKPLKVIHFHPIKKYEGIKEDMLEFFKGANKINTPFITERLVKIFSEHGIS